MASLQLSESECVQQADDLVARLLTRDRDARLSGGAVRAHPFFAALDFDSLRSKSLAAPGVPSALGASKPLHVTTICNSHAGDRRSDSSSRSDSS